MQPPRPLGWFDRAVEAVAPQIGLRRMRARLQLQYARAYEAASARDPWKPRRAGASPAADHAADATTVRHKARALYQNNPYITAGIDGLVSRVVGSGFVPVWSGDDAERVKVLWEAFDRHCSADGLPNLASVLATAFRAREIDGEALIRLRTRRSDDGLEVPLQLQVLECDLIDTARDSGAVGGNEIVNGIEYDALGRVAAFWLFDRHPGDWAHGRRGLRADRPQSRRVDAASIIHLHRVQRPGQGRGVSRLAPIIARARDLSLYEDAEIARKNLEARLAVLVSGDPTKMANPPSNEAAAQSRGDLGELASGGITALPDGVSTTVVAPNAAPGYVDACKWAVHAIASGMGVPYELCTGDMREVNYSSARVRMAQLRLECEQTQWLELVPRVCAVIAQQFEVHARLANRWPRSNRVRLVDWTAPRWESVNPLDDVQSDLMEVTAGFKSISENIRRRGYKPETVFKELQQDLDQLSATGVLEKLLLLSRSTVRADATGQMAPNQTPRPAA